MRSKPQIFSLTEFRKLKQTITRPIGIFLTDLQFNKAVSRKQLKKTTKLRKGIRMQLLRIPGQNGYIGFIGMERRAKLIPVVWEGRIFYIETPIGAGKPSSTDVANVAINGSSSNQQGVVAWVRSGCEMRLQNGKFICEGYCSYGSRRLPCEFMAKAMEYGVLIGCQCPEPF